jgi:hypothetical protein
MVGGFQPYGSCQPWVHLEIWPKGRKDFGKGEDSESIICWGNLLLLVFFDKLGLNNKLAFFAIVFVSQDKLFASALRQAHAWCPLIPDIRDLVLTSRNFGPARLRG